MKLNDYDIYFMKFLIGDSSLSSTEWYMAHMEFDNPFIFLYRIFRLWILKEIEGVEK